MSQASKEKLLRATHARWRDLSPDVQAEYRRRAGVLAETREGEIQAQIVDLREQAALRRRRVREAESADQGPMRLGICRFTDGDLAKMDSMLSSDFFSAGKVNDMRSRALVPPPALDDAEVAVLTAVPPEPSCEEALPLWAATVCTSRQHFQRCAFCVVQPGGETLWFAFMYAKKSPRLMTLAKLEVVGRGSSFMPVGPDVSEQVAFDWAFELTGAFVPERGVGVHASSALLVLPGLVFGPDWHVFSHRELIPFQAFVAHLPVPDPIA